jgi:hypothetical protein
MWRRTPQLQQHQQQHCPVYLALLQAQVLLAACHVLVASSWTLCHLLQATMTAHQGQHGRSWLLQLQMPLDLLLPSLQCLHRRCSSRHSQMNSSSSRLRKLLQQRLQDSQKNWGLGLVPQLQRISRLYRSSSSTSSTSSRSPSTA